MSETTKTAPDAVWEAVRKLALNRHVRETHSGPVWNGGSCRLCKAEWAEPFEENERHRHGCLAALSLPGQSGAEREAWQDISTAPKDRVIEGKNLDGARFEVWWQDAAFKGFPINGGYMCVPFLTHWREKPSPQATAGLRS